MLNRPRQFFCRKTLIWIGIGLSFGLFLLYVQGMRVLPPDQDLFNLSNPELRELMMKHTNVGMSRKEVEAILRWKFRADWHEVKHETRKDMATRGFTSPIQRGDYYLRSDLASHKREWWSTDVITIYLLFGANHELKDVVVEKWTDSI